MATALSSTHALLDVQLPNLITVCWVPQGAAVQKKNNKPESLPVHISRAHVVADKIRSLDLSGGSIPLLSSLHIPERRCQHQHPEQFHHASVCSASFHSLRDEAAKLFSFSCTKCLLC